MKRTNKWKKIISIVSNVKNPNEVLLCFDDSTTKLITPDEPLWHRNYYVGQLIPFKVKHSRA